MSKKYQEKKVLENVSLEVSSGEVIGLLGPNGAGKSTIMKVISGLAKANHGGVFIDDEDITKNPACFKRRIGVIPQENNLEREITVKEALYCYALLFGVKDFDKRLSEVSSLIKLDEVLGKTVRQLSGGFARRALIARALLPDPDILLLDEPSVGLDPDVRQQLWELIRNIAANGKGVLITTHYMEEAAQLCDRIYFLHNGNMAWHGTPHDLERDNTTLEKLFISLAREGRAS